MLCFLKAEHLFSSVVISPHARLHRVAADEASLDQTHHDRRRPRPNPARGRDELALVKKFGLAVVET